MVTCAPHHVQNGSGGESGLVGEHGILQHADYPNFLPVRNARSTESQSVWLNAQIFLQKVCQITVLFTILVAHRTKSVPVHESAWIFPLKFSIIITAYRLTVL